MCCICYSILGQFLNLIKHQLRLLFRCVYCEIEAFVFEHNFQVGTLLSELQCMHWTACRDSTKCLFQQYKLDHLLVDEKSVLYVVCIVHCTLPIHTLYAQITCLPFAQHWSCVRHSIRLWLQLQFSIVAIKVASMHVRASQHRFRNLIVEWYPLIFL